LDDKPSTRKGRALDASGSFDLIGAFKGSSVQPNEINKALKPFRAAFEATSGYPPGDNLVSDADEDHATRNPSAHPSLPDVLPDL
jgi:hypothetical protein